MISDNQAPASEYRGADPRESELQAHINLYLSQGGKITVYPAEPADPRKFRTAPAEKPSKPEKLSKYEKERVPKAEALGVRMNLSSTDFQNVPGTAKGKIEVGEIYAALAMGGLSTGQQNLVIWYWTQDKQSRSGAWAYLICRLVDTVMSQNWGTRKRGILAAMVDTALDQLVSPRRYEGLSDRAWSRSMGLANHSQWGAYKPRYNEILSHAKSIVNLGDTILERQI